MKQELETLRAELHSIVDLKIDKLIKPEFEFIENNYYELQPQVNNDLQHVPAIICYSPNEGRFGYGLSYSGTWTNNFGYSQDTKYESFIKTARLMTHTEVQQALEKEAVKRGFKEGVKFITAYKNQTLQEYKVIDKFYYEDNIGGLKSCLCSGNGYIFCNGIWAEIVKPMSLEELCGNLDKMRLYQIQTYLTENKTQIIETLNNL